MRRFRAIPISSWWLTGLGAFLCVAAGLVVLMSPLGSSLSLASHDLLQRWQPLSKGLPKEVVVVSMDDRSFIELRQDPTRYWDRSIHTRLVRSLTQQGAKVIVFDILFNAVGASNAVDAEFAAAMRAHGNVVIAAKVEDRTSADQAQLRQPLLPDEPYLSSATWGAVEYAPDADGVVRRILDGSEFTSLSRRAAERFKAGPPPALHRAWLRFYGPAGSIPTVSYCDALDSSALPKDWCRGRIVFVGHGRITPPKNVGIPDEYATPRGLMPGVEIQATTCANLLRSDAWREAGPIPEFLGVLLLGIALGGTTRARDVRHALGFQAALLGVVCLVAWVLPTLRGIWSPWLIPLGVQAPVAAGWAGLAYFVSLRRANDELAREKLKLERKLDSYPEYTPAGARPHTLSGAPSDQVALLIPDYSLIKVIGSGAYGEVWLARSLVGSHVAIKILFRDRFDDAEPYEREFRGIKRFMSAAGSHPGWVHVLHVGRIDQLSCFYYVMEIADDASSPAPAPFNPEIYVPKTLRTVLTDRGGKLPPEECIELALTLTEALGHRPTQGLIHRDIKPANVIFVRGLPRFADVGLVTAIARPGEELTQVGTMGYLAPEGPGTAVADLYGLGKLLYVCFTGNQVRAFPEPPSGLFEGKPNAAMAGLNDVILRACEVDPSARFRDTAEMTEALEKLRTPSQ